MARALNALLACVVVAMVAGCAGVASTSSGTSATASSRAVALEAAAGDPYLVVLGIAQDGGVPQAGAFDEPGWTNPAFRRRVVSLGIVEPASGSRYMLDATPDFGEQLRTLCLAPPAATGADALRGVFLTHAHIGHYTGLMFLGHEALGAHQVPVFAMPRMRTFLESNGPWSQLVEKENITLHTLAARDPVALTGGITLTPIVVPHRQEFSEVAGFIIGGPHRRVLFIPDIDSWSELDATGVRIEDLIASADVAYLDGTFFANGEIPGRDMTAFPHPFITTTMNRLAPLSASERSKVRFIHLNHTNPALWPNSAARREIDRRGFAVADELERVGL